MARSNVKTTKRAKNFLKNAGLDKKKHFEKKVKPVMHKMMDAEKKRAAREEKADEEEEARHMDDVRRLEEIDPELKEYLDQEDPDFGDAIEEELGREVDGDDEEHSDDASDGDDVLTQEQATAWFAALSSSKSAKAIKKVVFAFKSAVATGYLNVGQQTEANASGLAIKSTELFEYIITEAVMEVPKALNKYLGRTSKSQRPPHKCEDWEKVRIVAKAYATGIATLLGTQGLPESLVAHVLRHSTGVVDYLYTHTGAARALLKACLHHVAHNNEKVQLMAFLLVREMALPGSLPPPFTDICMKGMYLTFVKNTRSFTVDTHKTVSFVMNECVELFGVDLASAYQHVFVYTRQLAVYLKTALQSGAGEEAFRHVYNWQYINSLRLWAMTVAKYNTEKELFPLVYPIAQIACGVVELFPAPKTFPLHLIVIGIINHLSRISGAYISVSSFLLRILSSPEFQKHYKAGDNKPVDLMFMLRAKKADMASQSYQSAVFAEALYLLTEYMAINSHSIGFPELAYPVVARLKKLAKEVSGPKWSQGINSLLQKVKNNSQFIVAKRKNVNFGPSDTAKVSAFEAAIKEAGTPLFNSFMKDKEKRDEMRKMRLEALSATKRKTVDEYADDEDSESEEGGLAGLAQTHEVDEESAENENGDADEEMEDEDEDDGGN